MSNKFRKYGYKKLGSGWYQISDGYYVEKMANGLWDAYLAGSFHRLWESVHHRTMQSAVTAISAQKRWISKQLKNALSDQGKTMGE